ncbi:MAG: hypothetical protein JWR24_2501 [Actinoallomurus sp.]|nr:hypothetical protein [Actinoallomurus sp.]
MSGFQVIYRDLAATAQEFNDAASGVDKLRGDMTPNPVPTGDGELDGMLGALFINFGALQDGIVRKLRDHHEKLGKAHDNYKKSDSDVARLLDKLMEAAKE